MTTGPISRTKAFLIHLSISVTIFLVLLGFILLQWYPSPYFAYDGGWRGIRLVAGIDLVLGPLLTLIVFKPGKKGLRLDLAVIALIQFMALTYGVTTVYRQRTALVVYFRHALYTVSGWQAAMVSAKGQAVIRTSTTTPPYVQVVLPKSPLARYEVFSAIFKGALPPYLRGSLYQAFSPKDALGHGLDVEKLVQNRPADQQRLQRFLHGQSVSQYTFVPLDCRYRRLLIAVRRSDGRFAGTVDINPYPLFSFY